MCLESPLLAPPSQQRRALLLAALPLAGKRRGRLGHHFGRPGDAGPTGLQLGKRSGAPWGADGVPLALLSRLKRSFAMSFGLTCLSAIAASTVIHIKNRVTHVDVTGMS